MKNKLLLVASAAVILLGACRKEEPAELPSNGEIGEAHCNNGVRDADEDGVDCGPSCEPCVLSIADCGIAPTDNTFKTTGGVNLAFAAGNVVASTSTGVLVITGTVGSSFVRATFTVAEPQVFASYGVNDINPGPYEVRLEYFNGSGYFDGYSDLVHLNRVNGKLSIEFCDVYMSIPTGGYTIGSGKLTEN